MADVFISYSRRDATFVRELHAFLTAAGKDVWVDWEDIPPASQWERDIGENIDAAESFVFVISRNSLASEYCTVEFERAQERGKRVVPLAWEGVDPAAAPAALGELNWIWCREGDDRDAAFDQLTRALDTDLEWVRAHTRLLVRAAEWDARRDRSLLLHGRDLEDAAQQLALNAGKEPAPTELQQQYVVASRRASAKRQRVTLGGVTLALVVSLALGVVAFLQRNTANERARASESQTLVAQALEALSTAPATALADVVKAIETSRTPAAKVALRRAILANPIEYVIPARSDKVDFASPTLAFSGDGSLLLGLTPGGALHVWRSASGRPAAARGRRTSRSATAAALAPGRLLAAGGGALRLVQLRSSASSVRRVPAGERVAGIGFAGKTPLALLAGRGTAEILDVVTGRTVKLRGWRAGAAQAVFSGDGNRVVTLAPARVWDARTGRLLATLPDASSAALSADGRFVATIGNSGAALWSVDRRTRLAKLGAAVRVLFSPNGGLAVGVGENGDAGVWQSSSGRLLATLPGFGSLHGGKGTFTTSFNPGAAFSADGRLLALAASDGIVRVWELATRKQVAAVGMGWANTLAFAPGGNLLAAMTWNGDVVVAHAPASVTLRTGFHPAGCVADFAPLVSPDGTRIVAPAAWGAGVWDVDGKLTQLLRTPARPTTAATVGAAAFSGDGTVIAAQAVGGFCSQLSSQRFWTALWRAGSRSPFRRFPATSPNIALDPHASLVTVGGKAWRTATGARVHALDGIVALSPDGRLALARRGRTASIVRVGSGAAVVLRGFGRFSLDELSATFSSDGRRVVTWRGETLRLWDTTSGEPVGRLGHPGETVDGYGLGTGGRLVLVRFEDRAATFSAADGSPVSSVAGRFDAISPDGALAAAVRNDGSVEVVDLATQLGVAVQTDTGGPLDSVSFGPEPGLLVAIDQKGDVHVLRCETCGTEAELLTRARSTLVLVSRFHPKPPPVTGVA